MKGGPVDLARVELRAARDAARKRGAASEACTPRRRARMRRDPQGLAAVPQQLMADQAWEVRAASGSLLDRWPEIAATGAERLAEHVQAVAFERLQRTAGCAGGFARVRDPHPADDLV
ncbi:DUF721 domain-containing protein [Streptomyces malaysiensis]|uniref:Uncharacterized protein n=1 Tax=Streptomyces malaysiensis TaxID=92644 RepID=A0A7X5WWC2_STRMQ|nr:hypothetical protein [Streptomyces malaysiensis]NIY62203.1 hypothetical protein [Streptomyces malaysiensis]